MEKNMLERIRQRYGRLLTAVALIAGGVAIGLSAEPRGVTATETRLVPAREVVSEQVPTITSFRSVLRFNSVCVIFSHNPISETSCWTVHDLKGNVLGIYADQTALETFFPEVDSSELLYAALRNGNQGRIHD
jgi:hypothetical protein